MHPELPEFEDMAVARQYFFNKVWDWFVVKKNSQSVKETGIKETGMCVYRGPLFSKCAFGVLIPDDLYKEAMDTQPEGGIARNVIINFFANYKPFTENIDFIGDLQDAHDRSDNRYFTEYITETLTKIATRYNLEIPIDA